MNASTHKTGALIVALLAAMAGFAQKKEAFGTNDYVRALKHATDIMVNDVTSPVAAARYYAYINLAANETVSQYDRLHPKLGGVLKGMPVISVADSLVEDSDEQLAAILAIYEAGSRLMPSGYRLRKNFDSLKIVARRRNVDTSRINASERVVKSVIQQIMQYASADGFVKLSGYKRFTPQSGDEYWQPTAPGFMSALEPYWNTLRTFVIDSASQYSFGGLIKYDPDSNSAFYKQMREVYFIVNNLTKEQKAKASFWDCNPYALQQIGHLEFGLKKISPGGHWMGITGIACKKRKLDVARTAYVHALVSITLSDAFVTCWDTKYRYNRVRPETAIKRLMDRSWQPYLQTPPFPEYTSGHSVISTAAAFVLTGLFGDHFAFTDDSEKEFGLPSRKFSSFLQASQEAAISRLYGGIHYRDAVEMGQKEGEKIGQHILRHTQDLSAKIQMGRAATQR